MAGYGPRDADGGSIATVRRVPGIVRQGPPLAGARGAICAVGGSIVYYAVIIEQGESNLGAWVPDLPVALLWATQSKR